MTPLITYFQVALSRSTGAAIDLLGENFGSLRSQNRSVLDFIRETITAHRGGFSTPSLVPRAIDSEDMEVAIVPSVPERKDESMPLVA